MSQAWDYVIVGAGTAGLTAAVFAAGRGARVVLLEAADKVGGTLHLSTGQVGAAGTHLQRAKGIVDSPESHYDDLMRLSNGNADPVLTRRLVDHGAAAINWFLEHGLEPIAEHPLTLDAPGRPGYSVRRYLWSATRGKALLAILERELAPAIAAGRVDIRLGHRASRILTAGTGAAVGVEAAAVDGPRPFHGRHLLLTSGGYATNADLFSRLVGHPAYARISYPHSQGDGIAMGFAIGAGLRGADLHRPGTGSILSGAAFDAKVYERWITAPQERPPWEIWVNNLGRRFVNEDEPMANVRERALARQPGLRYAIVFDQRILDESPPGIAGWDRDKFAAHVGTHPMFHRAASLAELATRAGIEPNGLEREVADYNAVLHGADRFGRRHMPLPIGTPPYYAVIHHGHSATSSAGLAIDGEFRVLRPDGRPIRDLYAAGEVIGSGATVGNGAINGMMVTPAITFGRLLGLDLPLGG
jgi:fumarate reductase flavoprotein subunit